MRKVVSYLMLAVLLLGVVSCSKENDKTRLLQCVPQESCAIGVINLEKMTEKVGNHPSDNGVIYSSAFKEVMSQFRKHDRETINALYRDGAIEPTWLTAYEYEGDIYVAGIVKDEKRFKEAFENINDDTFTKDNGVQVCNNVVMDDGIFIFATRSTNADTAIEMLKQEEKVSIYNSDLGKRIEEKDDDLYAVVNIANIPNIGDLAYIKMGISTVYKNAQYLELSADFDKGEAEMKGEILNANFEPARINSKFKMDKLSTDVVKQLPEGADMIYAIDIPASLIDNIMPLLATMGGNLSYLPADALALLRKVDGTLAVGMYEMTASPKIAFALEMSDNAAAQEVVSLMEGLPTVSDMTLMTNGRMVIGAPNGLSVTGNSRHELLSKLDDSCAGLILSYEFFKGVYNLSYGNTNSPIHSAVISAENDDNSVKLEAKAIFGDKSRNSLLHILELTSK
jgi:hypothetical protein